MLMRTGPLTIFSHCWARIPYGYCTLARRRRCRIRPWIKIPGGSFVKMNPMDPAQNGYYNLAGLSNGNFLNQQSLLEANGTNLVKGNTYYYRIKGVNSEGTDWADSTASFVSENALDTSTGTLTFQYQWTHPILVSQFRCRRYRYDC